MEPQNPGPGQTRRLCPADAISADPRAQPVAVARGGRRRDAARTDRGHPARACAGHCGRRCRTGGARAPSSLVSAPQDAAKGRGRRGRCVHRGRRLAGVGPARGELEPESGGGRTGGSFGSGSRGGRDAHARAGQEDLVCKPGREQCALRPAGTQRAACDRGTADAAHRPHRTGLAGSHRADAVVGPASRDRRQRCAAVARLQRQRSPAGRRRRGRRDPRVGPGPRRGGRSHPPWRDRRQGPLERQARQIRRRPRFAAGDRLQPGTGRRGDRRTGFDRAGLGCAHGSGAAATGACRTRDCRGFRCKGPATGNERREWRGVPVGRDDRRQAALHEPGRSDLLGRLFFEFGIARERGTRRQHRRVGHHDRPAPGAVAARRPGQGGPVRPAGEATRIVRH